MQRYVHFMYAGTIWLEISARRAEQGLGATAGRGAAPSRLVHSPSCYSGFYLVEGRSSAVDLIRTAIEEIFVGEKICTFPPKTFHMEFNFVLPWPKKIITAEIFMRLIRTAIMWYHARSTSICNASSRRAEPRVASMSNPSLISHDFTWLSVNLMNFSAVTIFLARVVLSNWSKKKKGKLEKTTETPERTANQVEENLVWKFISYIFQLYESYEIKFSTKMSSFTFNS